MYAISITTGFNSHYHSGGNLLEPSVCVCVLTPYARTRRAHPRKPRAPAEAAVAAVGGEAADGGDSNFRGCARLPRVRASCASVR